MDASVRHRRIWEVLYVLFGGWLHRRFRLDSERVTEDGPILLISNHVTAWDPLLVGLAFRHRQLYFVASEHIFRWGLIAAILNWMFAPISRRKGAAAADTVKNCLRYLKAGHAVCIFGEGEQCWDGKSRQVIPGTGKLAKISGATLVTYRLEGGYLSLPRWGRGLRRGRMRGRVVGVYPPERLAAMNPGEINTVIDRDIFEDAWVRQEAEPVAYRGRRPAERLERMLYLCPSCGGIGTLRSERDRLRCSCGLDLRLTELGTFEPDTPFATIADWETWEREQLHRRAFRMPEEEGLLFRDEQMTLSRIAAGHRQEELGSGVLSQYEDRLVCAGRSFSMDEIQDMAMTQTDRLLFTVGREYYQIRAGQGANLRKYLEIWIEKNK